LRENLKTQLGLLKKASNLSSLVDVLQSLAYQAVKNHYCRPDIHTGESLRIKNGRHPVVEQSLHTGQFVPNDLTFTQKERFYIITGPNMAGKSTYLRQTALITLMAHTGSFVPADEAYIPLVDRIFCRVGASDNLTKGESTFYVEMSEAAHILRNSTSSSLIIMDEVGRGTSTHEGLSLAWAISEYILNQLKAKTLFATHYHELVGLKEEGVGFLTLAVQETQDHVVFLKKVVPGTASNSYGIYVAQLAGIPSIVTKRAKYILERVLESEKNETSDLLKTLPSIPIQSELFSDHEFFRLELEGLELDQLSPLKALELLYKWKKNIES